MARKPAPKKQRASAGAYRPGHRLPAAEFKAHCLELMDRVRETGAEYVVTKHGTPVAKLVPYRGETPRKFRGCLKGTLIAYERPFDPIPGTWTMERGLLLNDD